MKYVWLTIAVACAVTLIVWWLRSRAAPRDIETALAQMLANMFEAQGVAATVDGQVVEAAGHRIRLDPVLENILQNAQGFTVGIAVEVVLDGQRQPSLTVGTMGVAADDEATALTQAFEEWGALCGLSLVAALGAEHIDEAGDGLPEPHTVGDFTVYPGLIGTRGEAPGIADGPASALLEQLGDVLADRFANDAEPFHGVLINVAVDDAERDEHCIIDGEHDTALGAQVMAQPWPAGSYMFKQFFLFVRSRGRN